MLLNALKLAQMSRFFLLSVGDHSRSGLPSHGVFEYRICGATNRRAFSENSVSPLRIVIARAPLEVPVSGRQLSVLED